MLSVIRNLKQVPIDVAKFYAAQIVSSLIYIHSRYLIYRDLKPENILIADNGYIKIADFGFVKRLCPWDRTSTFCGTPEYMAPEIVRNLPYSQAVDWYALGIILYELIYGRTPFNGGDPMQIFHKIVT